MEMVLLASLLVNTLTVRWRVPISCGLVAKKTEANLEMFRDINNYFGNIGIISFDKTSTAAARLTD